MAAASAGYGIVPAHPPLPTARNLPFHPDAGNQISVLMSESLDGVSVAVTRQNGGNREKALPAAPPRPDPTGEVNAPAATTCAESILELGRATLARFWHAVAAREGVDVNHAVINSEIANAVQIGEIRRIMAHLQCQTRTTSPKMRPSIRSSDRRRLFRAFVFSRLVSTKGAEQIGRRRAPRRQRARDDGDERDRHEN